MNSVKILAIVLIVAGVLGLVYGSFSYTEKTHEAKVGPIRAVGKGQADGQRPGVGRRGGNSGRRRAPAFLEEEELTAS